MKMLVLAGLCLVSGWVLTRTSIFRLKDIRIDCEDRELIPDLERRLLSLHGKDLYRLSLSEVQNAVLAEPRVRNAFVRRVWPSSLRIEASLRPVVALMFRDDGRLWMIDDAGKPFAPMVRPLGYPILLGFSDEHERLPEVAAWIRDLRRHEFERFELAKLNEVEWKNDRGLVARSLENDLEVELGFSDFSRSIANADKALTMLEARKLRANILDASYVRRVVLRPRENLQIPSHGLNLKEIEPRGGESTPAVR